jgi:hypothetical protein
MDTFDKKFTHNGYGKFWQTDGLGYETAPVEVKEYLTSSQISLLLAVKEMVDVEKQKHLEAYEAVGGTSNYYKSEACHSISYLLSEEINKLKLYENTM